MTFTKKEIADTLLSSVSGKILAFNIVHAVHFGVISKAKISEFLQDWWQQFLSGDDDDLSVDNLENTFHAVLWEGEKNAKGYLAATSISRTTENSAHGFFYHIKEYEIIYKYVLNGYVSDSGDVLPAPDSVYLEDEIEKMRLNKVFDAHFKIPINQKFSPEYGIYWVCPEKDLNKVLADANMATKVRDFLGLAHIDSDCFLISVKLAPKFLENNQTINAAFRPTPIDAGFHSRFKCLADKHLGKIQNDEAGYTFNLEEQSNKNQFSDGSREFIAKTNDTIPLRKLAIKPLGKTTSCVEKNPVVDNNFIQRLEAIGNVKEKDLAKELIDLI